jgi:AcrR family transcriptional regulator
MDRTSSTRERVLQQGVTLMSQCGLSGVTFGILADHSGLSKSGLFAHFNSIQDVQISLLRHTAHIAQEKVIAPAMQFDEGLPRLKALVENWLGWSAKAGLAGGCPIAAGMFELDDIEGPVRDEVLALERRWRDLLIGLSTKAVETGELRSDLDIVQFVWELCGIYLSHHASLRFVRDPDADRRARIAVDALIDRARSGTSVRSTPPRSRKRSPPLRSRPVGNKV